MNENDYLSHHGILGQKWGVRRFQNPDGTLTAEGKLRYGIGDSHKVLLGEASKAINANDLNKRMSEIDHKKEGSTREEVSRLMLNVGLDLVMLNPIGAAFDVYRIGQGISANAREKEAEKRIAKAEIDEKTGLPLKAKEMTAEQDVRMVNPGYHNFNSNTKNNCALCSTTFELRRRGFDVVASKASIGYTKDDYLKWFKGAKEENMNGMIMNFTLPSIKKGKEIYDWANPKILSQGNGARGYLNVIWSGASGHSMAYEVRDNKVLVFDAQSGKKRDLRSITNACVDIEFVRLDNLTPDYNALRKAGVIS